MDSNQSTVAEWYKGRNIFITGGTGFMGKVLLEKLLFSCPDVGNIYILMRSKRGRTPKQRVEDIWNLPLMERVRRTYPSSKSKLIPVIGDLVTDNLGLNEEHLNTLINNANIAFHCAATLKLEATLPDAVEQNTAGTLRVVELCKQFKHLDVFIHMSTAFCSADLDVFEEKVYFCKDDPRDVINTMRWLKPEAVKKVTKDIIAPHPNTYTYSKRLAEHLVADEAENMNIAIVRPSIVTPAATEPIQGWVDNLNGPIGLIVAGGKGVLRSMYCIGHYRTHSVPVDIAINAMIVVAHNVGKNPSKSKNVPVYNFTNDGVVKLTWGEILAMGKAACYKYPFEQMVWYPDGDMRHSYALHLLYCILFHWLPALFIDGLMFIFRQKRFMIHIQKKIHNGLELLQFFTTRQWNFASERFLDLKKNLSPIDREIFQMNFPEGKDIDLYLEHCVLGSRQYCMKEDLKSLKWCRIHLKVLYVIDKAFALAFYLGLIWFVYSNSEFVQNGFDKIQEYVNEIPSVKAFLKN